MINEGNTTAEEKQAEGAEQVAAAEANQSATEGNDALVGVEGLAKEKQAAEATVSETEYDETKVLSYLQKRNPELKSIDEAFTPKEVIKEVDKYEGVNFDDDDLQYLEAKKQMGINRKQFEFLKTDFTTLSPADLALEMVKRDFSQYSKDDQLEYLESELGFNPLDEDLSPSQKMKLSKFVDPFLQEKLAEQEKIKNIKIEKPASLNLLEDYVDLGNGSMVKKEAVEKWQQDRQVFESAIQSVNSVADEKLSFEFDEKGVKETIEVDYSFNPEGLSSAKSIVLDYENYQKNRYRLPEGGLDVQKMIADAYWLENKASIIKSSCEKAAAKMVEKFTKISNNDDFKVDPIPPDEKNGVRIVKPGQLFKTT